MRPFRYVRPNDPAAAIQTVAANQNAKFLAGGTNILDLMKEDVERPSELIDISRMGMSEIRQTAAGLSIGALAKNKDTANHPLVRQKYPLLSRAILAGASAQIRNMATNGGNLMQQVRCWYFYDVALPCNRRNPGSGCSAIAGLNQRHAIFGYSEHCVAVNPSDMSVALAALDAVVKVRGPGGKERSIAFTDFHLLPGNTPHKDKALEHGELITSIEVPKNSFSNNSYYLKIGDRASFSFALISVAAALELNRGTIKQARVALGGVANKPWRAFETEKLLAGKPASLAVFEQAAAAEMKNAQPLEHNGYKVELGKRAIVLALQRAMSGDAA